MCRGPFPHITTSASEEVVRMLLCTGTRNLQHFSRGQQRPESDLRANQTALQSTPSEKYRHGQEAFPPQRVKLFWTTHYRTLHTLEGYAG